MSDRELYEGHRDRAYVRYPVTPGHEWSGTVEEVGEGVSGDLTGRRVVAEGFRNCGTCARCRAGDTSLCSAGYEETGFTTPGAFADHVTVPARLLHVLDDAADLRAAALLEPAAVVAGAVRAGGPEPGDRVAVVGGGTLGMLALQLLGAASPGELTLVEPRTGRGELAVEFGADRILTPQQAEGEHGRFDLVLETAGADSTAGTACLLARRGGTVVLTGVFGAAAHGVAPARLTLDALTVRGVFGASTGAWAFAVRAFGAGLLDPARLITHELPLECYGEAVALVGGGAPGTGKVLLVP
jgi:threonine dehydrogenase-like Zn-dependent dehydrogenase